MDQLARRPLGCRQLIAGFSLASRLFPVLSLCVGFGEDCFKIVSYNEHISVRSLKGGRALLGVTHTGASPDVNSLLHAPWVFCLVLCESKHVPA